MTFQVTIHEDTVSIADSIFSMRLPGLSGSTNRLNGRYSKQSSLSIHSGVGCVPPVSAAATGNIKASPIIPRGASRASITNGATAGFKQSQLHLQANDSAAAATVRLLPRQESSFTQEEIFR